MSLKYPYFFPDELQGAGNNLSGETHPFNPDYWDRYWRQRKQDVREIPALLDVPDGNQSFTDPLSASEWLKLQLADTSPQKHTAFNGYFVYFTGGFDCGRNHQEIIQQLGFWGFGTILGLEPDTYFWKRDRKPHFTPDERRNFWLRICSPPAAIIELDDYIDDYDKLAEEIGVYKNRHVIHIASADDSVEILMARRGRAYSDNHCLVTTAAWDRFGHIQVHFAPFGHFAHVSYHERP